MRFKNMMSFSQVKAFFSIEDLVSNFRSGKMKNVKYGCHFEEIIEQHCGFIFYACISLKLILFHLMSFDAFYGLKHNLFK